MWQLLLLLGHRSTSPAASAQYSGLHSSVTPAFPDRVSPHHQLTALALCRALHTSAGPLAVCLSFPSGSKAAYLSHSGCICTTLKSTWQIRESKSGQLLIIGARLFHLRRGRFLWVKDVWHLLEQGTRCQRVGKPALQSSASLSGRGRGPPLCVSATRCLA